MTLKNKGFAAFCLVSISLGFVSAAYAQENKAATDKPAAAGSRPADSKPAVSAQPSAVAEDIGSSDKFQEDVNSAYSRIRRMMAERGETPAAPAKVISTEDKEKAAKAEKAERMRMADALDAGLRAKGIWDTDEGRQSMAMSSYLREDYNRAVEQFTKAIEAQSIPEIKALITVDRGEAYFAKGDKANALKDLEAAMKLKAANKESNIAELAWKLGRVDDAKRETERAAANQRAQTPGFVANWGVCHDLKESGKPAAGCMTSAISGCARLYGTDAFAKNCSGYEAEAKYLQATGFPCPKGECKSKIKVVPQPVSK